MKKAAIDIGTNTVLLLVADYSDGHITPIYEERRTPRLGKGVDAEKHISEKATQRVIDALEEYHSILNVRFPEVSEVIVTATSAVRDASNRSDFIEKVKRETGYEIRLLSGIEEAECTAKGALSVLNLPAGEEVLILDIGGGSTELAHLKDGKVVDSHSFDMGSVRFTERFLSGNPPSLEEMENCRSAITRFYKSRAFKIGNTAQAVGVAGTVTTMAGLIKGLKSYQPEKLNGFLISLDEIRFFIKEFKKNTQQQMLEQNPVYLKGREDIFLAGLLILEGFIKNFKLNQILVSTGGIRHGAIIAL